MNINGIGTTGYPAWHGARKTHQNTTGKNFAEQVNNAAAYYQYSMQAYWDFMNKK